MFTPTSRSQKRRAEILENAIQLILESGLANLTTKKVAQRVGLSEAAIYRYFPRKNDLLKGVFGLFKETFVTNARQVVQMNHLSPTEQLVTIYQRNLDYQIRLQGMPLLFFCEVLASGTQEQVGILKEIFLEYYGIMKQLIEQIKGPKCQVRPEELAMMFVGVASAVSIARKFELDAAMGTRFREEVIPFLVESISEEERE
jgi:AcrR family transcriptional regulator